MTASLLNRIASGDPSAFKECIDRYSPLVWSLCRRYSPSSAEAEDASQDVFLSLWKNAHRFDQAVASEPTFIAMITRRRLIDRRRRAMRRPEGPSIDAGIGDAALEESLVPRAEPDSAAGVGQAEDAARAVEALRQLRPEQRQVLELSLLHGRSYQQIASATNQPLGTVKTHARRGLMRIRELLGFAADSDDSGTYATNEPGAAVHASSASWRAEDRA